VEKTVNLALMFIIIGLGIQAGVSASLAWLGLIRLTPENQAIVAIVFFLVALVLQWRA
jgi:hypothetical protein